MHATNRIAEIEFELKVTSLLEHLDSSKNACLDSFYGRILKESNSSIAKVLFLILMHIEYLARPHRSIYKKDLKITEQLELSISGCKSFDKSY